MSGLLAWARTFVLSFGGPGLFFVAFLDSSFLSLPEINDILIVWMVTQHKERFVYYVTMATLGSIAGCLVLFMHWRNLLRLAGGAEYRLGTDSHEGEDAS